MKNCLNRIISQYFAEKKKHNNAFLDKSRQLHNYTNNFRLNLSLPHPTTTEHSPKNLLELWHVETINNWIEKWICQQKKPSSKVSPDVHVANFMNFLQWNEHQSKWHPGYNRGQCHDEKGFGKSLVLLAPVSRYSRIVFCRENPDERVQNANGQHTDHGQRCQNQRGNEGKCWIGKELWREADQCD